MTVETTVFLFTIGLGLVHILVMAMCNIPVYGLMPLLGARDNLPKSDNVFLNRAWRANDNFKETAIWALPLLVLVQVTGDANATTALGAWVYFWSRVAYLPIYFFGVHTLRTVAWFGGLIGIGMIALQLF
ncbi:MAPEG family protein [Spectribacter hydrogenooxidans]|uniref:MAPEG family protein n=1 Tax=Spectribacter hydrogenoxidans TaxID=3075608 RepID=A0ABU3C126_9GAMM|nr:MAPEG family protein [Salinisphaera sp. W335]MDT0635263.1 MAPEG family protein [Salinisphaera sp. W335]